MSNIISLEDYKRRKSKLNNPPIPPKAISIDEFAEMNKRLDRLFEDVKRGKTQEDINKEKKTQQELDRKIRNEQVKNSYKLKKPDK
jgi:hypothetical protein